VGAGYDPAVEEGSRVEVRSSYDDRFSRGFEIVEIVTDGAGPPRYRVRRRSDGFVLPALFAADDVREDRRRNALWWH